MDRVRSKVRLEGAYWRKDCPVTIPICNNVSESAIVHLGLSGVANPGVWGLVWLGYLGQKVDRSMEERSEECGQILN